jgi:hypothetical protein
MECSWLRGGIKFSDSVQYNIGKLVEWLNSI